MTKLIDLSIECKEGGKTEVKIDETPLPEVKSDRWGGMGGKRRLGCTGGFKPMTKLIDQGVESKEGGKTEVKIDEHHNKR